MTVHSTAFEIEHPVPVSEAVKEVPPAAFHREGKADAGTEKAAGAKGKRDSLRKTLLTGAALAVLAGAAAWNISHAAAPMAAPPKM